MDAVCEDDGGQCPDIVGDDKATVFVPVSSEEQSSGLRHTEEGHGGARGGAEAESRSVADVLDNSQQVLRNRWIDMDPPHFVLGIEDLAGRHDGIQALDGGCVAVIVEHFKLFPVSWVAEAQAAQEAVHLGFGEGIRAVEIGWVLRRYHEKRTWHRPADAFEGGLVFAHHLEECRLGARGCPVDFIGEDDIGEDRALAELEGAVGRSVNGTAGDVGRQQVRGELDPPECPVDGPCHGFGEGGLAGAGDVFEQDMASTEQGEQCMQGFGVLAAQHPVQVVPVLGEGVREGGVGGQSGYR